MNAPLGLLTLFTTTRDGNVIALRSRAELARDEQAYYELFFERSASGTFWKTATAFLVPPIAAVSAALALLIYAMH
jgi:hypothetical protein